MEEYVNITKIKKVLKQYRPKDKEQPKEINEEERANLEAKFIEDLEKRGDKANADKYRKKFARERLARQKKGKTSFQVPTAECPCMDQRPLTARGRPAEGAKGSPVPIPMSALNARFQCPPPSA